MIRSTPLKIFDENQSSTQIKTGKSGGLGLKNNDGPVKKGLQPATTRKALSNLSTSQINIRQTPAKSINIAPMKGKATASVKSEKKIKAVENFYVDDFNVVSGLLFIRCILNIYQFIWKLLTILVLHTGRNDVHPHAGR